MPNNVIAGDGAIEAIRDFVICDAAFQQAKEAYKASRSTVLNLLPKEIGEHSRVVEGFTLTIKYPEKVTWDAEQLDALYGTDKPAHVKCRFAIDMRVMKRLPQAEQDTLKQCYTEAPGSPEIDIVKV